MRGNIDERGKKLFIGGLHLKTTEESLKSFYSKWGEIVDVVVMRDPQTGKSRGFGFVTYSDTSSVDEAQSNRPHEVDGIKVDSKRAMPKEDTSPEFHATVNRLFVGRLKKGVNADDLRQFFGEYGSIADAVIINNSNGESRGFGFVTFDDTDSVDKIIVTRPHQMDGQIIEVKKALPREDSSGKSNNVMKNQHGRHDNRNGNYGQSQQVGHHYKSSPAPRGGPGYSTSTGGVGSRYSQHPDDYSSSYGNYPSAISTNNNYSNRQYGNSLNQGYSQGYSNNIGGNHSNKYSSNNRLINDSLNMDSGYGGGGISSGLSGSYDHEPNPYLSSYGQYDTPNPPSSRYGYSYSGGMGDYVQRQGGGPMRGGPRPNRGSASSYGNYPY